MSKAYHDPSDLFQLNDTLYISGSHHWHDWWDDRWLFVNKPENTTRYKQVNDYLDSHPDVHHLVGHSLGGSVAEKIANERGIEADTHDSPAWDVRRVIDPSTPFISRIGGFTTASTFPPSQNVHRHRNYFDPVSWYDNFAVSDDKGWTHEFS